MRRSLALWLICLWGWPVAAQLRLEALEFGFNGRYLPETLTPLSVTIGNGNTALNALLEVTQELRAGEAVERVLVSVALPPRTRKTLALDFLVRGVSVPVHVRLLRADGHELIRTEIELRERWSDQPLVLALEAPDVPGAEPYPFDKLPQRWTSYESVQRLYWGRLDPARLSDEQRTALYQWVLRGGELVILGGSYALEHLGLGDLSVSPETPQGWWAALLPLRRLQILEDAGELRLDGELRVGARVIARDSLGRPLWWERPLGLGRVWLSATEAPGQWERLPKRESGRVDEALLVERALGREIVPVPSRLWLVSLLVVFVLGVAALNAWQRQKPQLGLPLTVAWAFSLALVLGGYLRQPDFIRQYYSLELSVLWGWSGERFGLEQSWYAIFSRRAGEQQLTVRSDAVKNLTRTGQTPRALSVNLDSQISEKTVRFYGESLSLRSFKAERFSPAQMEFLVDASGSPPKVFVSNRSSESLERVAVRWRGAFYRLGEVAAQSDAEIALIEASSEEEWARDLDEAAQALWYHVRGQLPPVALVAWRSGGSSLWGERDAELRRARNLVVFAGREREP
ncbi:MAG: hypothetical protein NZ610_00290 [Candidatus Bipolaricaulota bacterium]|nr:hypothetical protein [Candidatus Bipolaricaulota bacterium]MCS7273837.1 hypothetical protein [Candidatus Bipolaricaulota bacterium]MDW8110745.1 hypothetical protein [Candidatus Bipolaricaulota bacterium]MDW8328397.1 hypothetical protein [Candidatus Bipolaricaulota bacterium]